MADLKTIIEQQSVTYNKIRYFEEPVFQLRIEKERLEYLYEKWRSTSPEN